MSTLLLDGLMTQLTQRLTAEGVDLVRRPFYGNTDFNCPLLAICVNVSRIGADAKEALKGVVKGTFLHTEKFCLHYIFAYISFSMICEFDFFHYLKFVKQDFG